jgi:hypothetical protein
LVGVLVGPSRRETRLLVEQAIVPMIMAITIKEITTRFLLLLIIPPSLVSRRVTKTQR